MPRKKSSRAAKQTVDSKREEKKLPSPSLRNGRTRRKTRSQVTYTEDADSLDLQFTDPEIKVIESSSLVRSASPPDSKSEERPVRQSKRVPKKKNTRPVAVERLTDSDNDVEDVPIQIACCDPNVEQTSPMQGKETSQKDCKPNDEIVMLLMRTDETGCVDVVDEMDPSDQREPCYVDSSVQCSDYLGEDAIDEQIPNMYSSDSSPSESQVESSSETTSRKKIKRKISATTSRSHRKQKDIVKISDDETDKKESAEEDLDSSMLLHDSSMVFQPESQPSNEDDVAFDEQSKSDRKRESTENLYTDSVIDVTFTIEKKLLTSSESVKSDTKESPEDQSDESDAFFPIQNAEVNEEASEVICSSLNDSAIAVDVFRQNVCKEERPDDGFRQNVCKEEGQGSEEKIVQISNNNDAKGKSENNSDTETASETELAEGKLALKALENEATMIDSKVTASEKEKIIHENSSESFKSPADITRRKSRNSSLDTQIISTSQTEPLENTQNQKKKTVRKSKIHKTPRRKRLCTPEKEVISDGNMSKEEDKSRADEIKSQVEQSNDDPTKADTSVRENIKVSRNAKINAKSSIKKDCDEENEDLSSEPEYDVVPRRRSSSSSVSPTKANLSIVNTQMSKKGTISKRTREMSGNKYEGVSPEIGEVSKSSLKRKKVCVGMNAEEEKDGNNLDKSPPPLPTYSNKKWIYNSEHKTYLYGDKMFLADRHDLTLVGSIHLWRIRSKQKLLQKFIPVEIDGRDCHCGVDTYKSYSLLNDDIYVKYQPVIVDMLIDTDDRQVGMYYSMDRSFPVLGYFQLTESLFAKFKEFLKHMTMRAMTDSGQLKPAKTIKSDDGGSVSAAVDHIEGFITSVLEGIMIRPHWPQTTMICLLEYPNFSLTRAGVEKDGYCAACVQKGKTGVGAFKICFYGSCYDAETLALTNKDGPQVPDNQFCYACPVTLRAVHRLVHYKYWVFMSIRMQLQQLYSRLKPGSKYNARDVFDFILGDFQWIKHMFYEFQTITGEGIQAREKADRQDKAMEKKEKAAVVTTVRKTGKSKGNSLPRKTAIKNTKDSKAINSQPVARKLSVDSNRPSLSNQRQVKKNLKIENNPNGIPNQSNFKKDDEVSTDHLHVDDSVIPDL